MRLVVLIIVGAHVAHAGKHSLKYYYTGVTGDIDFPEFTAVGLVDDEQFMYFDSNIKKAVPKTEWIRQNERADYWNRETQNMITQHQTFKNNIQIAKERLNQSAVSPQVSLLQKSLTSPVTCHATGFYPKGVTISWMRNGQEHHEDVVVGELIPNEDGTFQKTSTIRITPNEWKKNQFSCLVKHQSKTIRKTLRADEIITNSETPLPISIILGAAAVVLLIVIGVVGCLVYQKKKDFRHFRDPECEEQNQTPHTGPPAPAQKTAEEEKTARPSFTPNLITPLNRESGVVD
ncbi:MHC class I alpha [Labeo rohita]|uniref:MHC class I alpha n=1 Tax=Labeo rohita TaxID=84645 RepID=A0A498P218_LABRO|nr:MHC class I alpha [Labeo rohita]